MSASEIAALGEHFPPQKMNQRFLRAIQDCRKTIRGTEAGDLKQPSNVARSAPLCGGKDAALLVHMAPRVNPGIDYFVSANFAARSKRARVSSRPTK